MLDRFSPETALEVLSKREGKSICTLFMGVPAMYREMIDHLGEKDLDFEHIRLWTSGSAPLPVKDFAMIKAVFGKEPVEREGMSETGMNFSNPLHGVRRPGSIGLPMPDLQARLVDPETHKDVDPGQTGEIWLKGPTVTPGYWRKPEETARAFEEGWFRTGDLGRADGAGYYTLTDRIKHIIISGGENISPKEIETVIDRFKDVVESCVVGVPDKKWGEKVVAAVAARPGSSVKPQEIQKHCMKNLHDWKCPKEIIILKKLPKNIMGKVLQEEIRELFKR
jgi:malonyl-CoA/methylmalonyl-CoA synthetase